MTIGFVRATKAYLLPTVVQDVFRFRKAYLTTAGVLRSLFDAISTANGTATAVSTLRGNYEDAIVSCGGFQPSDYESVCPWGILSFVESAASTLGATGNITEAEVRSIARVVPKELSAPSDPRGCLRNTAWTLPVIFSRLELLFVQHPVVSSSSRVISARRGVYPSCDGQTNEEVDTAMQNDRRQFVWTVKY